ncbi:MAG: hypothetical protein ACREEB_07575 [Caulobacteraceae bacterium]
MTTVRHSTGRIVLAITAAMMLALASPVTGWSTASAQNAVTNTAAPATAPPSAPAPAPDAKTPGVAPAVASTTATQRGSDSTSIPGKAPQGFVLVVIGLLVVLGFVAIGKINGALAKDVNWSLANALSEDVNMPAMDSNKNPIMVNGAAVLVPTLVASTSRLIALYGLFAILLLYLGFGGFILYDLGTGQNLPANLGQVQGFLLSGLTLFAPYLVNQFAGVFSSLAARQ